MYRGVRARPCLPFVDVLSAAPGLQDPARPSTAPLPPSGSITNKLHWWCSFQLPSWWRLGPKTLPVRRFRTRGLALGGPIWGVTTLHRPSALPLQATSRTAIPSNGSWKDQFSVPGLNLVPDLSNPAYRRNDATLVCSLGHGAMSTMFTKPPPPVYSPPP